MDILGGIIITVLAAIGFKTVCMAICGRFISGADVWQARIIINVLPTAHTPMRRLDQMLSYIRAKYLPNAEICILCDNIVGDSCVTDTVYNENEAGSSDS